MISAGTGTSSDTAADPRTVVEVTFGTSPDDVSEGDRLNLTINNFFPSEVTAPPDMRLFDKGFSRHLSGLRSAHTLIFRLFLLQPDLPLDW